MDHRDAVMSVSSARANLTKLVTTMRNDPEHAEPVVFGSHRRPEAVIIPYEQFVRGFPSPQHHLSGQATLRDDLSAKRELIRRLADASNIGNVSVFGSVARGEETDASDVDLLVETTPETSYFDLAQFATDVETLIGRPVDVVPRGALDGERDRAILQEAVVL